MKRLISLILAVALLLSLAPAVFADGGEDGGVALVFGTATLEEQQVYNSTEKVKYYAIPVSVKNTTSATVTLSAVQCYFDYDASSFEPANIRKDKYDYTTVVSFEEPLSRWSGTVNGANGRISVPTTTDEENYYVEVAANGEEKLFTLNLVRKSNIENGNYSITFSAPFLNEDNQRMENKMGLDKSDVHISYSQSGGNLNLTDKGTISIIDGALPTLDSVSMKADDEGGLDAVYGQTKKYTLTATSTKGADISDKVTWSVSPSTAELSLVDNELTVSGAAAGEYTVTATPKADACQGNAATATFKVTPATITNPTVTVTGFGKGAPVSAAAASVSEGLTYGNDIKWYKDDVQVTEGNFAGSSTYKAVFTLSADKNHQLAANATVTVSGVNAADVVSSTLTGPDAEGKYTVTLTLKTADKDMPVVKSEPSVGRAEWGMTLADVKLIGGSAKFVRADGTEIDVPGTYEWMDTTKSVGEPTADNQANPYAFFKAKFVPTDTDTYAVLENISIRVVVHRVLIHIDTITNWDYTTAFQYNGEPHKVELVIPENLRSLVNVAYVDNEKTAFGTYTAKATISEAEPAHYLIEPSESKERTLSNWEITKGTLSAEDKTVRVRYGTPSKPLTLAELGLSALANEPGVDITFVVNGGNVISSATKDSVDGKLTGITLALMSTTDTNIGNTGSVTLTITSDNYETKTLTVTVEIINKNSKSLTVTGPASFPYGTTADTIKNALTVTGLPDGYDASKVEYTFSASDISAATPGDYTVTVTYETDDTIYTGTFNFKITKLDLAKATITSSNTLTYTGAELTQNVTVKYGSNVIEAENYTVTGNKQTNAGRYTLTVTATEDSTLYTGSKTYEFIILKAVPKTTDFSVTVPTDVTYDGQPHPAAVAQADPDLNMGGFTVSYVGIDGTVDAPVNAGEYTVSIKVNGNNNYAAVTVPAGDNWKFTIAKATPVLAIETADNATYTGQPYNEANIKLTSASNVSVDTYLYYSDEACTEPASPVNAGLYYVKVKFNGNKNYEEVTSAKASFRITKASYDLRITEAKNAEYTGNPYNSANITVSPNLSVTFTYYSDAACTNALPTAPTEVGTYYVKANYAGTANYSEAKSNVASFEITKVTLPVPPEIKVDGGDKKLSDLEAGMKAAMGGIGGTFEWYDSNGNKLESSTKIEANTEYRWKFYPTDADHYNPTEGTTTPYVRDDLSWLPGVLGGGSSFSFHDVNRFDYYYDSVKWAADKGIASGTSRFAFSPDAVCTRAQTVTFLWRAAGSPLPRYRVSPFTDVHSYDYYYEAVLWAVEQGITTGLTATTFGPDETVTRGQVATFLYRAASAAKPNTFNPFTDVKPTAYNYDAILWAYDNRITTGTSTTTFSPDAFCTRAQIVTFLYRYYQGR